VRNLAGFSLTWASFFLAIVAILIGSQALFYITTALIATILGCHLQAYLSIRALRLERVAPESVKIGDLVTIELKVWSLKKIKRTLITVWDNLPTNLAIHSRTPSLPIAPSSSAPVITQYQFRALKRGRFRWSGVFVTGTDALGLISKSRMYDTSLAEMTVLPQPLPVSIEIPSSAGWGINESESGQNRGAGIEPRGLREYRFGDSIRQIHWRSTAKTGQLLVKEFEAGSQAAVGFCIQRTRGSDIGQGAVTTLEQMCGNVVFLAETFIRQGAKVYLPNLDELTSHSNPVERIQEIYMTLATVSADKELPPFQDIEAAMSVLPFGSVIYVLMAVADDAVLPALQTARQDGFEMVALIYDAEQFTHRLSKARVRSAADPSFAESLRRAGVQIVPVAKSMGEAQ
jgi:uncharacterized protein (DUF58 family)